MNNFNAQQAREIVNTIISSDELNNILTDIKQLSESKKDYLHIYKPISNLTIDELIKRGFKLTKHSSIAIMKDGLYYSIYW